MFIGTFLILSSCLVALCSSQLIVSTDLGRIQGSTIQTWKGKDFYAFRGIRYAQPPINELRFRDPKPIVAWTGVFNATLDGPMCPQPDKRFTEMSEDCLRINVYTHGFEHKRPVLLYIHGGGLYVGSGVSSDYGGPDYLMEHDLVLVTFNYRLGTLGFLSLGSVDYPGNAGFKDQVLAMRWVQSHIESFGGDPARVTLIGNSIGAMSIPLHAVSPMSQDLFYQAILGSGGISLTNAYKRDQVDLGVRQTKILGCEEDGIIECLMKTSMEEFVNTTYELMGSAMTAWATGIIENDFGQERFLVEDPLISIQEGRFKKFPIIAGVTEKEMLKESYGIVSNEDLAAYFTENYAEIYPIVINYEEGTQRSKDISDRLNKFYGTDTNLTVAHTEELAELLSDGTINFGTHRFTKAMLPFADVYSYQFTYTGQYSHFYYPKDEPYAAVHSDDFIFLLVRNRQAPLITPHDKDAGMVEHLTQLYANFVIKGNPNGETQKWMKLNIEPHGYLNIGQRQIEMEYVNVYKERFELWETLFPIRYPTSNGMVVGGKLSTFLAILLQVVFSEIRQLLN